MPHFRCDMNGFHLFFEGKGIHLNQIDFHSFPYTTLSCTYIRGEPRSTDFFMPTLGDNRIRWHERSSLRLSSLYFLFGTICAQLKRKKNTNQQVS